MLLRRSLDSRLLKILVSLLERVLPVFAPFGHLGLPSSLIPVQYLFIVSEEVIIGEKLAYPFKIKG